MDVLAQPVADRTDLAVRERLVLRADLAFEVLPELRCDHRAERVAREVAEEAGGPMDVLEDADAVVGHADPEQPAHAVIPRSGKVGDFELAADQRRFELEAQDDVQR